jgi:hypothetical protein
MSMIFSDSLRFLTSHHSITTNVDIGDDNPALFLCFNSRAVGDQSKSQLAPSLMH